MFIGQGGGEEEEKEGLPFVGKAGKRLTKEIKEIKEELGPFGYSLTNSTRNHPTDENGNNRPPNKEEIDNCLIYLERDIDDIDPEVLIPLGASSAKILLPELGDKFSITQISGKVFKSYFAGKERIIVPCIHPSYVMREETPDKKYKFNSSIKKALYASSLKHKMENKGIEIKEEQEPSKQNKGDKGDTILLDKFEDAEKYLKWLIYEHNGQYTSLDVETRNLNKKYGNYILTFQFATDPKTAYVIPYKARGCNYTEEEHNKLKKLLRKLFSGKVNFKYWLIHHYKYENTQILNNLGCMITSAPVFDTMVGAYLLDETKLERGEKKQIYALERCATEMLGFTQYDSGIKQNRGEIWKMDFRSKKFLDYAGMDAYILPRIFEAEVKEAKRQQYVKSLKKMMFKFYTPVTQLLTYMEWGGLFIDTDQLLYLMDRDSPIISRIKEIGQIFKNNKYVIKANNLLISKKYKMTPRFPMWVFDPNKPAHSRMLFFKVMKLEPVSWGKERKDGSGKSPSVGSAFQEAYEKTVEEVKLFAEYKGMLKLVSSYMNQIYKFLGNEYTDHKDGRLRPDYSLTSTTTGRSNCVRPNMQQVPRGRNNAQKQIKNMFAPGPNNMFIMLDYATNEVRWLALLSHDEAFCRSFIKAFHYRKKLMEAIDNKDIEALSKLHEKYNDVHKQVASMMNGIPFDEVTPDQRQDAKVIDFGLIFGKGPRKLCIDIGKDPEQEKNIKYALGLMKKWFSLYPEAKQFLDDCVDKAKTYGFVETPLGRRRRLPEINSSDGGIAAHAANQSKNSPVQGTASDTAFLAAALMLIEYIIPKKKLWRIPMIVHDSCVMEIPRIKSEMEEALRVMEYYFTVRVPEYITSNFEFKFSCPLDIDLEISQPATIQIKDKNGKSPGEKEYVETTEKCKYGHYGYGTAKKWKWTHSSLESLTSKVDFLSMKDWMQKEGIKEGYKNVFQAFK